MNSVAKIQWVLKRLELHNRNVIAGRKSRIVKLLNREFYGIDYASQNSASEHARYLGSFVRGTSIRSVSDVDLLFELPPTCFRRYNDYTNNGQSALLQLVKNCLFKTIPTTEMSGDGQVVVVDFTDLHFDILPAFKTTDDKYIFPDTHDGGSWKTCDPIAEIREFRTANLRYLGKVTRLAQLARAWRESNNVPMSGFLIDTLVFQFLGQWNHSKSKGLVLLPEMIAEFLYFLSIQDREQGYWLAPGSYHLAERDGLFEAKADKGFMDAVNAINYDKCGNSTAADTHWKSIFGRYFQGAL